MSDAQIKIQKFAVNRMKGTPPLEDLLKNIGSDKIAARARTIHGTRYRLDDITHEVADDIWCLNFVRNRTGHGPGKFANAAAISGFTFGADESFGEDTAALFDPKTRFIYIQYNHVGMRHSSIEQYLSSYTGGTSVYTVKPKLELNMERQFQKTDIIRRLELGFDITKMTAADRAAGQSLASMASVGSDMDADKLFITMSISSRDPTKRLSMQKIKDGVAKILPLASKDALIKARAYGGEEPAVTQVPVGKKGKTKKKVAPADFEVIDLLDQIIETKTDIKLGADFRMPLNARYNALKLARKTI